MTGALPFRGSRYLLRSSETGAGGVELRLTGREDAGRLGRSMAEMDPWARLGTSADTMAAFLGGSNDNRRCFSIDAGGELAGAIAVLYPWLSGPYLNLLAILPGAQRTGLGRLAIDWFEAEAIAGGMRNAFLCVSAFNTGAIGFYKHLGYVEAALLGDLIKDGEDEFLMRKRLR
jgi:diamine N-acetyltransferase